MNGSSAIVGEGRFECAGGHGIYHCIPVAIRTSHVLPVMMLNHMRMDRHAVVQHLKIDGNDIAEPVVGYPPDHAGIHHVNAGEGHFTVAVGVSRA